MGGHRVLVVGGDAAGASAASQAKRRRPDLDVVVVERGSTTSYSACGIPYWTSGVVAERDELVARSPAEHRRRGLDVRVGVEVVDVDLAAGRALLREVATGAESHEGFDELVLATGAEPVRPDVPGVDAAGVLGVRTLDDGAALREALRTGGARDVVVVGGGYIGLEVAEAARALGLRVAVVARADHLLGDLDPEVSDVVAGAARDLGVEVVLGDAVVGVETTGGRSGTARAVRTASGRALPADVVVLGAGVRPRTELAVAAGVPVGEAGGIVVDDRMRTPVERVWAAGDCAQSLHRVSRAPVVLALGTHANKQGRVLGLNLAGQPATFPGVIGTAITKVGALEVARTGLSSAQAADAGFDAVAVSIDSSTRAGYYPGAAPVTVRVVAERGTGRLLGGQLVGGEGAGKRVDALAVAVWNAMAVDEVAALDLAYAPPFSPAWDPVLVAARTAAARLTP